jgi:hypothetical protein
MNMKIILAAAALALIMSGAAVAQQEVPQAGDPPGPDLRHEQLVQEYVGTLEREGDEYLLMVGDQEYRLEVDEQERLEQLVGQEVAVRGILEQETIRAEAVGASHDVGVGPGAPERNGEQPMTGQEVEPELGPGGTYPPGWMTHPRVPNGPEQPMAPEQNGEQPMAGQEVDPELGPGGTYPQGWVPQDQRVPNGPEQPMAPEQNGEQPMVGQEVDPDLGPGGVFPPGWVPQEAREPNGAEQPVAPEQNGEQPMAGQEVGPGAAYPPDGAPQEQGVPNGPEQPGEAPEGNRTGW